MTDLTAYEEDIQLEVEKLLVQREARRRLAEATNLYELPEFKTITEVPARPRWRVEGMLPAGGYVLISAQKKAGKTTIGLNLIRALIDGTEFLGEFRTFGRARVALIDFEMSDFQLAQWIKDAGLLGNTNLQVMRLRGQAKALGLLDDDRREKIAQQLTDFGADVLIIDPLGPLLRALGVDENSNSEVGRVVDSLLALKEEAGISELVGLHHHGKDNDLGARGASVLADTPDALWQLKRDDRSGLASLTAYGRDVDAKRSLLFNPDTRALTTMRFDDVYIKPDNTTALLDALRDADGPLSSREVWNRARDAGYSSKQDKATGDLRELEARGDVINTGKEDRPKWALA